VDGVTRRTRRPLLCVFDSGLTGVVFSQVSSAQLRSGQSGQVTSGQARWKSGVLFSQVSRGRSSSCHDVAVGVDVGVGMVVPCRGLPCRAVPCRAVPCRGIG